MLASDFEKYQFHSDTEKGQVVSGGYPIMVGGGKKPTDNDWIIPLGLVWGSSAISTADSTDHVVSDGIVGGSSVKSSIGGCGQRAYSLQQLTPENAKRSRKFGKNTYLVTNPNNYP